MIIANALKAKNCHVTAFVNRNIPCAVAVNIVRNYRLARRPANICKGQREDLLYQTIVTWTALVLRVRALLVITHSQSRQQRDIYIRTR